MIFVASVPRMLAGAPAAGAARHGALLLPLAAVIASAALVSLALAAGVALAVYRCCVRSRESSALEERKGGAGVLRRFAYSELSRATDGFAESHRLGQGGFGPVFRGVLPRSGQAVAVKLMDAGSLQGEREFQNELSLAEKILSDYSSNRGCVVPAIGFCISDRRRRSLWWLPRWGRGGGEDEEEEAEVCKRMLLVYELMPNGSLQNALLDRRCAELLRWTRRFTLVLDIAFALQFLHTVCDPPIIHGDIKPSNILLDSCLSARIADFGLARIKSTIVYENEYPVSALQVEDESVVEVDLEKGGHDDASLMSERGVYNKRDGYAPLADDASTVGDTMAESTMTSFCEDVGAVANSLSDHSFMLPGPEVAPEAAFTAEVTGFDRTSIAGERDNRSFGSRGRKSSAISSKDWWWQQDSVNSGNSISGSTARVKDYVMEWIRSDIKERPKGNWIMPPTESSVDCLPNPPAKPDRKTRHQRKSEWWASLEEENLKDKKRRPAREWWREEFCEELASKHSRSNSTHENRVHHWWQNGEDILFSGRRKRSRHSSSRSARDSMDSANQEVRMTVGRRSLDHAIDIPKSGTVSSTPSMKGTICYVAPEYGGGGALSEKCDIYSFGVLLLVLISGRRPLQMTASPISEFERANLVSWARCLARKGRLSDLVDPSLQEVDKEQTLLCITVALLCIQRSPARRPSIKEVVAMLTCKSEPSILPIEFSPSPSDGFSFKSGAIPAR